MLTQRAASSLLASSSGRRSLTQLRPAGGRGLTAPGSRQCAPARRASHTCRAFNLNKGPDMPERILASLPYLLPLLDTLPYGRYLFLQFPFIARALAPLGPVNALYHLFPFAPFIIFLGVYSGIVNNQSLSRYIRYNAMQAVLLDILLIIPQVLLDTFGNFRGGEALGIGTQIYVEASNTIFLFVAICVAYGMGACAVGQTPRLPLVAEAADSQVKDGPSGW